ncbi:MAG: cobalt-precorrin 5A hydrolase, partial [Kiloniellales bacterium]
MSGAKNRTVIVALTARGGALAQRIAAALPGAQVHGREGRVEGAGVTFDETTAHLQALFAQGRPIVGLCAAGILVRALAPLLAGKQEDPPLVAVAEDGSAVVPLLGGHRGANDLARSIAAALGVAPAITTAGDLRFGVALDEPPPGWRLANPEHAKDFTARLLAGENVKLEGAAPWLAAGALPFADEAPLVLQATIEAVEGAPGRLVYHPPQLALGVGCARGCPPEELQALLCESLAAAGLSSQAVAGIYSLALKSDEPAVHALAESLSVPARFFDAEALKAEAPRLATPSEVVEREVGVPGVAEAAALAAAGPEGCLILPKRKSANATCAV